LKVIWDRMKAPDGKSLVYMAVHALTGGVFGFLLQRFAFHADLQTSLIWAGAFFCGAGFLAWQQSRR
jgi:hypothetical protein